MQRITTALIVAAAPALAAAAPTAFVPNQVDETVSVVDLAAGTETTTIGVRDNPAGVAATADGATIYITNENGGAVSVIDTAANSVSETITLPTGRPEGIDLSPDESTLYVADTTFDAVYAVDTASGSVTTPIAPASPSNLQSSADGSKLYVGLANAGDVEVYDTGSWTLLDTLSLGTNPGRMVLDPDTGTLYVATQTDVHFIDTSTDTVSASVDLSVFGHSSGGIALDSAGGRLYVGSYDAGHVRVVDIAGETVADTFTGLGEPRGVALVPGSGSLLVVDRANDEIKLLDAQDGTLQSTVAVGEAPVAIDEFVVEVETDMAESRPIPTLGPVGLLIAIALMLVVGGVIATRQRAD